MAELLANQLFWFVGAAVAFLSLGIFTWLGGGGGLLREHLLALSAAGVAWSAYFAVLVPDGRVFPLDAPAFGVEMLFMLAWFALLYRLLRGPYKQSMPETVRRGLYLFWALILLAGSLVTWLVYLGEGNSGTASYYSVIALSVALICFALSAQLTRDAPIENGQTVHALAAAGGVISGTQVLTFGVATLTAVGNPVLEVFRVGAAACAAVLVLYAVRRRPQWSLEIFVSPQARAYTPRLLAMLILFLLLLAFAPLYRSANSSVAQPLAVLLICFVGAPVAFLLFSEKISARLRVFVSKHFLPFRYDYREEWLRLIDTLASPAQRLPLPERSIKAVAQIVGAPAGVLWLKDSEDGPFTCAANWNTRLWSETPVWRNDPALEFMCDRQWILDMAELTRDPDLYSGLKRPTWLSQFPDALLIVPLVNIEALLGFIVLFQSSSAFRLTFEEIDLLRTSGRQVAAHLAQYQADQQLAEVQQFEAFNRLTAFVMHDLKNLIAQQTLMVQNAAKHKANPAFFEDAMATIDNSVARMNKLLRQLQSGDAVGPRERVELSDALHEAIAKAENGKPEPHFEHEGDELFANIERERFTTVIAHLIRNAQDATGTDGSVVVRLREASGQAVISIRDDGCGMDPDFVRNRLFRPFDSTKGSKGMGIGAYQARTFATESGGSLNVQSEPEHGTEVVINLPIAHQSAVVA